MNNDIIDSSIPQCFMDLLNASKAIQGGVKGVDFLTLIDDDEMKGYGETELEERFRHAVDDIEKYVSTEGESAVASNHELVRIILHSLVLAKPAVDAYRSRMYAYATDWGSEVSSVGNLSRKLKYMLDDIIKLLSHKDREDIYKDLPNDVKNTSIEIVFWKSHDRHDSYYKSIRSILFPE